MRAAVKRRFPLLLSLVLLLSCAACGGEPAPYSSTTKDLGEGMTLVTDYDRQERKLKETWLYSGERYPAGTMAQYDPETGDFIFPDDVSPETVENLVVGYILYDYDGSDYAMRARQYQAEYPDTSALTWCQDELGRLTFYQKHNHMDWGITEDYYSFAFSYPEDSGFVEIKVTSSTVPNTLPGTKPVTDTLSAAYLPEDPVRFLAPGGVSYGADGISQWGVGEYDSAELDNILLAQWFDRAGNPIEHYRPPQDGQSTPAP